MVYRWVPDMSLWLQRPCEDQMWPYFLSRLHYTAQLFLSNLQDCTPDNRWRSAHWWTNACKGMALWETKIWCDFCIRNSIPEASYRGITIVGPLRLPTIFRVGFKAMKTHDLVIDIKGQREQPIYPIISRAMKYCSCSRGPSMPDSSSQWAPLYRVDRLM